MAKTLGNVIAAYRKKQKLSLSKFAALSGLSKSYVALLEKNARPDTGKRPIPSLDTIVCVARAMDMETQELMEEIGVSIEEKEIVQDARHNKHITSKSSQKIKVKPFEHIPVTQDNLNAAIREKRVMILPFRAPRLRDRLFVPMNEYEMAVAHTVTKVEGGVYEAYAEANGVIRFTLFDIGVRVFYDYDEARKRIVKKEF